MGHTSLSIDRDLKQRLDERRKDHESWNDFLRRLADDAGGDGVDDRLDRIEDRLDDLPERTADVVIERTRR